MKENKKKETEKISREEYLYHNTELLLKKYRDVVWSIEVAMTQTELDFELEMDCGLGEFLEMSYAAGADLQGTQIQEQMRILERNKKMLKIIEKAVGVLKSNPNLGEEYYWILYFTYLSPKAYPTIYEIIDNVSDKTQSFLSQKTYFKYRKAAINNLSTILWGITSKDCASLIENFV